MPYRPTNSEVIHMSKKSIELSKDLQRMVDVEMTEIEAKYLELLEKEEDSEDSEPSQSRTTRQRRHARNKAWVLAVKLTSSCAMCGGDACQRVDLPSHS